MQTEKDEPRFHVHKGLYGGLAALILLGPSGFHLGEVRDTSNALKRLLAASFNAAAPAGATCAKISRGTYEALDRLAPFLAEGLTGVDAGTDTRLALRLAQYPLAGALNMTGALLGDSASEQIDGLAKRRIFFREACPPSALGETQDNPYYIDRAANTQNIVLHVPDTQDPEEIRAALLGQIKVLLSPGRLLYTPVGP